MFVGSDVGGGVVTTFVGVGGGVNQNRKIRIRVSLGGPSTIPLAMGFKAKVAWE
jgi:hypothetical protein